LHHKKTIFLLYQSYRFTFELSTVSALNYANRLLI